MLALLGISSFFSFLVSLILGTRLLRLASRTRRLPELAVGMAFMIAGVLGWVMMLISNARGNDLTDSFTEICFVGGYASISMGVGFTYLFIWRVFRSEEAWAALLFFFASAVLVVTCVPSQHPSLIEFQTEDPLLFSVFHWTGQTIRVGVGVWGALESVRYFLQMKKRQRLGLARPALTNRFLLWGFANTTTALICLVTAMLPTAADAAAPGPGFMLSISIFVTANGIAQWLAFLPPKAYLRWVESSTPRLET